MQNIGFIGLGAMGAPMARNLHKAGLSLTVWNRSPERAETFAEETGALVASSPCELGSLDAVVIMVSDPVAVESVLDGEDGLLAGISPGTLVINMSTIDFRSTFETGAAVNEKGGRFVDAPVSGTVMPAEKGELVILAGGDEKDIRDAQPLFGAMGRKTVHCGEAGQGTRMKLAINLMLGGLNALLAEGLSLARASGLDPEQFLETLAAGPLAAPLFALKGRLMLDQKFEKQFPVDLLVKDLDIAEGEAADDGLQLAITPAVHALYVQAQRDGLGDEDMAAVIKALRRYS